MLNERLLCVLPCPELPLGIHAQSAAQSGSVSVKATQGRALTLRVVGASLFERSLCARTCPRYHGVQLPSGQCCCQSSFSRAQSVPFFRRTSSAWNLTLQPVRSREFSSHLARFQSPGCQELLENLRRRIQIWSKNAIVLLGLGQRGHFPYSSPAWRQDAESVCLNIIMVPLFHKRLLGPLPRGRGGGG